MSTTLFTITFVSVCLLSLSRPAVGVYAYMINYIVVPHLQWWVQPLASQGARFSLFLSLAIAAGMIIRWGEISKNAPRFSFHEQLVCAFVLIVVLSRLWGVQIDLSVSLRTFSGTSELPSEKMLKVAVFLLMLMRVVSNYSSFVTVLWVVILSGGLYTGYDAYTAPLGRYNQGRLDVLGGIDFRDSSLVSCNLVVVAILTGAQYLKSRNWKSRAICVVAWGLTVNAIILTQTRAAVLALGSAVVAAPFLAPRGNKLRITSYVLAALVAGLSLTNESFWNRTESITASQEDRDPSAAGRLLLWSAGLRMGFDNPLGVGAGSYGSVVGNYDPSCAGRDCHNTYISCFAELGVAGILLFVLLFVNAFHILSRVQTLAAGTAIEQQVNWDCYGLRLAFIASLTFGVFGTLTYVEYFWWYLSLPVCLERAVRRVVPTPSTVGGRA
jgi:hypothetical protein